MSATLLTYASREDWLAHRGEGIGASEAAAVLGISPWLSPFALWGEKVGTMEPLPQSEAMTWGLRLEPLVADHYAAETGRRVEALPPYSVHVSDTHPVMRASLDRIVHAEGRPGPGVLELKTSGGRRSDWDDPDTIPLHYVVQVQHQLAVTGWTWGSLAVLIGGQTFRWLDIERNDEFITLLTAKVEAFWDLVQRQEPPPVDGSPSTLKAIAALYPRERADLDPVALPPEADQWDAQRQAALEAIKAAEAQKAEAEAHLKALIGEAPAGLLPGGIRYTWATQERKGYVVEPSSVRVLRRVEAKRRAA